MSLPPHLAALQTMFDQIIGRAFDMAADGGAVEFH
jgi:hypothetical protein